MLLPITEFTDQIQTFTDFLNAAINVAEYYQWRHGQALFNVLLEVKPDLADEIRMTQNDPFYARSDGDPRLARFLQVVEGRWDEAT